MQMVQLTSSATRNELSGTEKKIWGQLDNIADDEVFIRRGWDGLDRSSHPHIADPDNFTDLELRAPWSFELRWRYLRAGQQSQNASMSDLFHGSRRGACAQAREHYGDNGQQHGPGQSGFR